MPLVLAVVLLVSLATAAYRLRHDAAIWTSDSAVYLRMALGDRGLTEAQAKVESDRFMMTTPEAKIPESAGFYGPNPPPYYAKQFDLFRSRPLYPLLSAALYGALGERGMKLISAAAYVLATLLMFGLLRAWVTPVVAGLGALAFATAPQVLDLSALPLTDELAVLFWIAALGAMLRYVRAPSPAALAAVLVAALLLTFTRPAAYLPFAAACGLAVALRGDRARRPEVLRLLAVTAGVGIVFAVYSVFAHGPGLVAQLRWQYDWQVATGGPWSSGGFVHWYVFAVAAAIGLLLTVGVYKYAALLPLVLAVYGARIARRDELGLLLGGAAGALAAILANPLEINRTALLPLTPIVVVLATLALGRLLGALRAPEPAGAAAR
ncbi:MAG TPA: glycosyltransferase family 39 protein [Candidatus Elarobacter sp.]|nr:glycosyltransferase family 39 protein [Candidatus Elarobacter sp.]